jgi:RNA polymerase sigma factor (sigma-70 family)
MTNVSPIIHIVDDDASFRTAIGDLLSACGYRVALYESAKWLLKTPPSSEPACILLDVQMAGLSGPQLQDHLAELGYRLPIVFVTGHGDIPTSVRTIKAGAHDFLTKPVPKERLLEAIQCALARYEKVQEQDSRIAALRSLLFRLTPRERDVFDLLVRGRPHKQIAHALGTSERTVKMHRHNVMQKVQVQSLAELAIIAERLGLLPKPSDSGNEDLEHAKKKSTTTTSNPLFTTHGRHR